MRPCGVREKINEEKRNDLEHIDTRRLLVFECTDFSINLDDDDERGLPNKLKKVFNKKTTKRSRNLSHSAFVDDSKPTNAK